MAADLPEFFFRVRENGAQVFRVDAENRNRRLELDQIATLNLRNGQIKAQGDHALTAEETAAIEDWAAKRREILARREIEDIHRAIDHLNHVAGWVQGRASDADLDEVTDALLLAMHDLRTVLVRKKADRMMRGSPAND